MVSSRVFSFLPLGGLRAAVPASIRPFSHVLLLVGTSGGAPLRFFLFSLAYVNFLL